VASGARSRQLPRASGADGWLLAAALAAPLAAAAQGANPYNGTWRAQFERRGTGWSAEATLVIADRHGTWQMTSSHRNNPCMGREYPVSIRRATARDLEFEIQRSKVLAGCDDELAVLERVDENTLRGEFEGRRLNLIRR